MTDRSAITSICLLGILIFLVLSSGVLQCAYTCIEEEAWDTASWHQAHGAHATNCHLTFPEPQQTIRCPDRSCHQSQAASRSLGGPVISGYSGTQEPVLGGSRLPQPDLRIGRPLQLKPRPEPILLAAWSPLTTTSQTLKSVKTTVLLN